MTLLEADHIFCELCEDIKPIIKEPLDAYSVDGNFKGGDLLCAECHFVIATIYRSISKIKGDENVHIENAGE